MNNKDTKHKQNLKAIWAAKGCGVNAIIQHNNTAHNNKAEKQREQL